MNYCLHKYFINIYLHKFKIAFYASGYLIYPKLREQAYE